MITLWRNRWIAAVLLIAIGSTAAGQDVRAIEVRDLQVRTGGSLQVVASFLSGRGLPQDQIDASRLLLEVDGVQVPQGSVTLQNFRQAGQGLAVLIAVDVSGSMSKGLPRIRDALKQYIRQLRAGTDYVAVGAIADNWEPKLDFTSDFSAAVATIDDLKGHSKTTALYESIHEGVRTLSLQGKEIPSRRLIIVVSDGMNEKAGRTSQQCIDIARKSLVQVHSIIFLSRINAQTLSAKGELELISRDTGGEAFTTSDLGQLSPIVERLRDQTAREIVLTLPAASVPADGREHLLRLRYGDVVMQIPFTAALERTVAREVAQITPKSEWQPWVEPLTLAVTARPWLPWVVIATLVVLAATTVLRRRPRGNATPGDRKVHPQQPAMPVPAVASNSNTHLASAFAQKPSPSPISGSMLGQSIADPVRKTEFRAPATHRVIRRLALLQTNSPVRMFDLTEGEITIGANDGNELVIDAPTISGRHARLMISARGISIVDLDSTNGTYIGEVRVGSVPVSLAPGQKIRLGPVVLLVY